MSDALLAVSYASVDKLDISNRPIVLGIIHQIQALNDQASRLMVDIGFLLCELEGQIGEKSLFLQIVQESIRFNPRTVYRFQTAAQNYKKHFAGITGPEYARIKQLPLATLMQLDDSVGPEFIDELKNMAANGKLSNSAVEKVLEAVKENQIKGEQLSSLEKEKLDSEAKLAELNAQLSKVQAEMAKMQLDTRASSDRIMELENENGLLQQDLLEESKKAAVVTEKEVIKEVLPKKYKSLEDAVNLIEDEITIKSAQKEKILSDIQAETRRLQEIKEAADAKKVSIETLEKIVQDVDTVIAKYPSALLEKITASHPESKAVLATLSKKLAALATQLSA